jgi:hypothetical protein
VHVAALDFHHPVWLVEERVDGSAPALASHRLHVVVLLCLSSIYAGRHCH